MMISKYAMANFLLLVVVVLLGFKDYEVWTHRMPMETVPRKETYKGSEKGSETLPTMKETMGERKSAASFKVVAEKNLFSPERKDFPIPLPLTVNQNVKPKVRPQVILHGVAIAEDYEGATVTSPGRVLRKGERESMTLKIGEKVGEYKLAKVLPDRITLENGNDSFEVLLYDPKKPKRVADTRTDAKPSDGATIPPSSSSPSPGVPPSPDPSAVSSSPGVPPRMPPRGLAATPRGLAAPLPSEASLEKSKELTEQQLSAPSPSSSPSRIPPGPSPPRFQPRAAHPLARQSRATLSQTPQD